MDPLRNTTPLHLERWFAVCLNRDASGAGQPEALMSMGIATYLKKRYALTNLMLWCHMEVMVGAVEVLASFVDSGLLRGQTGRTEGCRQILQNVVLAQQRDALVLQSFPGELHNR